ncbi:MAG: NAD(P)H-binding protein, partial [Actinomycetota bacterium]
MILVTGATGAVGHRVANQLHAEGIPVRAFVRDTTKAAGMLNDAIELAAGDFGDRDTLEQALEGVDTVFLACSNQPQQAEYEMGVIDAA